MNKKILTLDDLYNFYSGKKKSMKFDAAQSGYNICVASIGTFAVQESDISEGLLYGKIKAFHDLDNVNHSAIDTDVFEKNLQSMKDRPIMADIILTDQMDEDGNAIKDFNGHTMEYDEEHDKVIYIESPVGHFVNPEGFHSEYDEEHDRRFAIADVVIYEEYTDACDILRRRQEVSCSVELSIRKMSWDCKNKLLNIEDFYVQGCTLLGEHVLPGMKGSKLSLKDFSESNNSVFSSLTEEENTKIIEMQEKIAELEAKLSCFNINENSREGGKDVNKLEELLLKYSKTKEELTFEIEGLSDEELEAKFTEVFEESGEEPTSNEPEEGDLVEPTEPTENESVADPEIQENEACKAKKKCEEDSENPEEPENPESSEEPEAQENEACKPKKKCEEDAVFTKTFSLSHEDVRSGLYTLLSSYEESDNDWYFINETFDDNFTYEGLFTGKIWNQKYTKDGDNIAFEGERTELFRMLLTESEKVELENMRSNYSLISDKLSKYEAAELKAEKEAVFADEAYADFIETEGFKTIRENMDTYSVDELKNACELQFAKEVRAKKSFSLEKPEESKKSKYVSFASVLNKNEDGGNAFLNGLRDLGRNK